MSARDLPAAIAMVIMSALMLAVQDAGTKYLGATVSIAILLWSRYTLQAAAMALWIRMQHSRAGFRTRHLRLQALRGGLQLAITTLAILSLRHVPLGEFTAIVMLSPVVVTAILGRQAEHRAGPLRWALVLGGFAGTLVMIRPGGDVFGAQALFPVLTMAALVAYSLLTNHLAALENPLATQFYSGLTASLAMLPVLLWDVSLFRNELAGLPALHAGLLVAIALLSTGGHLLLVMAFSRARASALMPFSYLQIGFAALLGWLVFRHAPDAWAWTGMLMIAVCGGATAWVNLRPASNRA